MAALVFRLHPSLGNNIEISYYLLLRGFLI